MPRLVRKRPLWDRITSMLNPMDFLLWLSEEMETRDWDSGLVGTQLGLGLNFMFLVIRANSGSKASSDDIFGDESSSSWSSILIYPLCWALILLSIVNAVYTVSRTRKYRLFGADIDVKPSTPSARRVRVQSSPMASSPLHFIADLISPESAESRAHPEKNRDVWELSIWDPLPVCIRLLCLFSPGHVLVYLIFLPLAPLDPRPSVTVFNTLIMQVVLSVQMILLSSRYSQQSRDNAVIQKEVFHEYDTKFVQPRIHPVVRDVGTQMSEDQPAISREFVQVGTPTTLIRRSFITHGNPHVESEASTPSYRFDSPSINSGNVMKPRMFTPATASRRSEVFTPATAGRPLEMLTPAANSIRSSALRHSMPAGYTADQSTPVAQTPAVPSSVTSVGTSAGTHTTNRSNMGMYSQKRHPLKKAVSMGHIDEDAYSSPRTSREADTFERPSHEPPSSPLKQFEPRRFTGTDLNSSPHPFANMGKHGAAERFPKRWRG